MKTIYSAVFAAAMATTVASGALAGVSNNDAVTMCKAQAKAEFADQGLDTRIKFRGTNRKDGATVIRLQVYPKGADSFKATCSMNRQTGQILALVRDSAPDENLMMTAKR